MKNKNDEWLNEVYERFGGEMLRMDGYDDCIAGVCLRFGQEPILIYDQGKIVRKLMKDGMSREEALEFHDFN